MRSRFLFCAPVLLACLAAPLVRAGEIPPDHGFDFVTIGDPGNRAMLPEETITSPNAEYGAVAHEYRISTTEVSVGQWFEFVGAYLTVFPGVYGNDLTGRAIDDFFGAPALVQGHSMDEPANMSWEFAARYVNWLHNDKAMTADAFQSGVYDASTFTENPDGTTNHNKIHDPGAKFWIPTHDEWVKAAYWDPAKNNGDGGYWKYPYATDQPPVAGFPDQGGTSNFGAGFNDPDGFPIAVGSYPHASAPWGLLDVSGGMSEYTEVDFGPQFNDRIWKRGTNIVVSGFSRDEIDNPIVTGVSGSSLTGFRLAAPAIPGPSVVPAFISSFIYLVGRRKRGKQCVYRIGSGFL